MDYSTRGIFFDGTSSKKREVEVRFGDKLEILENDAPIAVWAYSDLRRLDAVPGAFKIRSIAARELANLTIQDKLGENLVAARAKKLNFDGAVQRSGTLRIVGLSLAAVASLLLVVFFGVPLMADGLAKLVPPWAERKLGDAVSNQVREMFGKDTCASPEGDKALTKLALALTTPQLRGHARIEVLDTGTPNAIALPGGQIFLFRGLLEKAGHPDEIAGVLAHELGHQAHRDGVRSMIQAGGSAFLLGLLFGDVTGSSALIFVFRQVLDSSHSREAETDADDYSRDLMHSLGRPAAPMARLLGRIDPLMKGDEKGSIFSSHPLTAERLRRLESADAGAPGQLAGAALLSPEEWQALKKICPAKS